MFLLNVSYYSRIYDEPCILDSNCRLVLQDQENSELSKTNTIRKTILPTISECMSILTSLGRQSCLQMIENDKKKPLGFNQTKEKILELAHRYDEDPENSIVRNLYGTVLQYKCPFGQRFSVRDQNDVITNSANKQIKDVLIDSYNITCLWNQTWENLYDNGTSLPICVGRYFFC